MTVIRANNVESLKNDFSVAVFPYLRTSQPISLGRYVFRSTDDIDDLPSEQKTAVSEITEMLFLQDNLRLVDATYTIAEWVDLDVSDDMESTLVDLRSIQEIVAYCYAAPRHEFGDIFLAPEHASMLILIPSEISPAFLHRDFNVRDTSPQPRAHNQTDINERVPAYRGQYNFNHYICVERGSRIYGPVPQMVLNESQDLYSDLTRIREKRSDYKYLLDSLTNHYSVDLSRVVAAVHWFNAANSTQTSRLAAIVNLSIAFESLLNLPRGGKTERLVDSISMLLGRTPRLDIWARQFYAARSQIVHEGRCDKLRLIVKETRKGEGPSYQTLISYGREIFQLCLGTIMTGIYLARESNLQDQLQANQERFEQMQQIMRDSDVVAQDKWARLSSLVATCQQYRHVPESNMSITTMIDVIKLTCQLLVDEGIVKSSELRQRIDGLLSAKRSTDNFEQLEAINALHSFRADIEEVGDPIDVLCNLLDLVWNYLFSHFYWLKESRQSAANAQSAK